MRNIFLVLCLLILSNISWSQSAPLAEVGRAQALINTNNKILSQLTADDGRILIKRIVMSGFVLKDKESLRKIMKNNQNKRLFQEEIQQIINDIKIVYDEAGYAQLVDISFKIEKSNLVITVLLLNR